MQIQISWLLQKPADLDLHYLLRQGMFCLARKGLRSPFPYFSMKTYFLVEKQESILSGAMCILIMQTNGYWSMISAWNQNSLFSYDSTKSYKTSTYVLQSELFKALCKVSDKTFMMYAYFSERISSINALKHKYAHPWTKLQIIILLYLNPCQAEYIKMLCPLLICTQSDYLIQVFDTSSH